jgi:hypothetical protein
MPNAGKRHGLRCRRKTGDIQQYGQRFAARQILSRQPEQRTFRRMKIAYATTIGTSAPNSPNSRNLLPLMAAIAAEVRPDAIKTSAKVVGSVIDITRKT